MLRLLLDEQLYSGLVEMLKAAAPEMQVESVHHWNKGRHLNQPDARILIEAHEAGLTLVSFDVNTIPGLIAEMMECSESHAGVIFASAKTFAQNDYGGFVRALVQLWNHARNDVWTDRGDFLRKS